MWIYDDYIYDYPYDPNYKSLLEKLAHEESIRKVAL